MSERTSHNFSMKNSGIATYPPLRDAEIFPRHGRRQRKWVQVP